jgi:hypothetical protein
MTVPRKRRPSRARRRVIRTFRPEPIYIDEESYLGGHGAALLYLIRDGIVDDWKTLCRAFRYEPREYHSGHFELRSTIQELQEAGLLSCEPNWQGRYALTDRCHEVQHALGVSLPQIANLPDLDAIAVRPFFRKPEFLDVGWHVFVLMPFDPGLKRVYKTIGAACKKLQASVARADNIFSATAVLDDITSAIYNAGIVIADCTGRNPNVFYELGVAHTFGRKVILLAQRREDVPFDIDYIRYITYEPTDAGLRRLESSLVKTMREEGKTAWRQLR